MTGHRAKWALAARLVPALLLTVAIPGSTSALQTTTSEVESDTSQPADSPSLSAIWDPPASYVTVVDVRPPAPAPAASEQASSDNPLWAIPLATLSNTRERPVFSASRRPPPPAASVSVPVAAASSAPKPPRVERPQMALTGTILGEDESYGIFLDQATKTPLRLRIGDDYQGWKLRAVEPSEVTLVRDEQTVILSLPQPGSASAGPNRVPGETVGAQAAQTQEPPPARHHQ